MNFILLFVIGALFIILIAFLVFSAVMFYHIMRYSLVGDSSKKVYVVYYSVGLIIVAVALLLIIINHLGS